MINPMDLSGKRYIVTGLIGHRQSMRRKNFAARRFGVSCRKKRRAVKCNAKFNGERRSQYLSS